MRAIQFALVAVMAGVALFAACNSEEAASKEVTAGFQATVERVVQFESVDGSIYNFSKAGTGWQLVKIGESRCPTYRVLKPGELAQKRAGWDPEGGRFNLCTSAINRRLLEHNFGDGELRYDIPYRDLTDRHHTLLLQRLEDAGWKAYLATQEFYGRRHHSIVVTGTLSE